jgi:sterol desaturase/sphingolipid hydroxylase (fatty acid hydroxylase superfamily)
MTELTNKLRRQVRFDSIVGTSLVLVAVAMLWTAIIGYSQWLSMVASEPDRTLCLATSSLLCGFAAPTLVVGIVLLSCAIEDTARRLRHRIAH